MELIDQVLKRIGYLGDSSGAAVLADALASACTTNRKVSLLKASISLDEDNMALFIRLCMISREPDYSNAAQDRALGWLRDNDWLN
jgi:hypothetical protein